MKKKTIAQRIDRALALETGLRLSSNDVLALDLEWHGRKNYDSYVTLSYPPVGQSGQAFQTRYDGLLNDHERQRLSANLDNMLIEGQREPEVPLQDKVGMKDPYQHSVVTSYFGVLLQSFNDWINRKSGNKP